MYEKYITVNLDTILKHYAACTMPLHTAPCVEAIDTVKGVVVYRVLTFDHPQKGSPDNEKNNAQD